MSERRGIRGTWRITDSEVWDSEALDSEGPAHLAFGAGGAGTLNFAGIIATIDYRVTRRSGPTRVEFTWEGSQEQEQVSGRGWAELDANRINGQRFIHLGDETRFSGRRRLEATQRNRARSQRAC